jgi:hypothetical protein
MCRIAWQIFQSRISRVLVHRGPAGKMRGPCRKRAFDADIIELCVRWYMESIYFLGVGIKAGIDID